MTTPTLTTACPAWCHYHGSTSTSIPVHTHCTDPHYLEAGGAFLDYGLIESGGSAYLRLDTRRLDGGPHGNVWMTMSEASDLVTHLRNLLDSATG